MSEALKTLETMVGAVLAQRPNPNPESIRELISDLRKSPVCAGVDDEAAEHLAREFEVRHGVTMTIGAVLTEEQYAPWLPSAKASIQPYYWDRYRRLLAERGFAGSVIATIDEVTDRVLGLLEDPSKEGTWDRRGMVMGHVQSGKTANYTGLICKAADAGYKLVVVIAGIHNNLRNQTQLRIDEGFVGRDSARLLSRRGDRFIGVGRYDQSRRPVTFTNSHRDFNKALATGIGIPLQNLNEPAVFVIKKNSSTLKNLLEWLREHSARGGLSKVDAPMLLIDDEADNASINISKGRGEVSRINGLIRDLLQMFERSCYVGYTATPFANIFIDPDSDDEMRGQDLFPKHFIVSLDPPSNYYGAERVFLEEAESIIRHIEDNEPWLPLKHTKEAEIASLPDSLWDAICSFLVGRAIRLARGHIRRHSSMLVNASRFTNVQRQIRNEVHNKVRGTQASLRINGSLPPEKAENDPEIAALHRIWRQEFDHLEFTWPEVLSKLYESAAPVTVIEVNSNSSGALNYVDHEEDGLNVIAVGGFSLSRGLTLEGLMVSYFLRNSEMYDTLMQMGRWFGYREGYEDLCRIWMTEDAEGWYAHITESIEMLRSELRSMEAANATPEEFGLKVRSHPDTLVVTARNKMGSGQRVVVSVGLGNNFIETATLNRDERSLEENRALVQKLAAELATAGWPIEKAERITAGWFIQGAPVAPIVEFVGAFRNHVASLTTDPGPVRKYIEERIGGALASWDVLFTSLSHPEPGGLTDDSLGIIINCEQRQAGRRSDRTTLRVTNKQRVASRGVEKTGLTPKEIDEAEASHRAYLESQGRLQADGRSLNYPDNAYRAVRKRPLLIIHFLQIKREENGREHLQPVVAYSISFPKPAGEEARVEYIVNTTWLRENFWDEMNEDEMAGDDE